MTSGDDVSNKIRELHEWLHEIRKDEFEHWSRKAERKLFDFEINLISMEREWKEK